MAGAPGKNAAMAAWGVNDCWWPNGQIGGSNRLSALERPMLWNRPMARLSLVAVSAAIVAMSAGVLGWMATRALSLLV
jgi:hypothetical protein